MTATPRHEISIEAKLCHELSTREKLAFLRVHRAYYSTTPAGFDKIHRQNYLRMMERQPNSVAYFVKIGGRLVGAALVLKTKHPRQPGLKDRWYSMAVHEGETRKLEPDNEARLRLVTTALNALATRIIADHPHAWGTVEADSGTRINFFLKRFWSPATELRQVLDKFELKHGHRRINAERNERGWVVYSRSDSVHTRLKTHVSEGRLLRRSKPPVGEYKQVLLLPNEEKIRKRLGKASGEEEKA